MIAISPVKYYIEDCKEIHNSVEVTQMFTTAPSDKSPVSFFCRMNCCMNGTRLFEQAHHQSQPDNFTVKNHISYSFHTPILRRQMRIHHGDQGKAAKGRALLTELKCIGDIALSMMQKGTAEIQILILIPAAQEFQLLKTDEAIPV